MIRCTTNYAKGEYNFGTIFTVFKPVFKDKIAILNLTTSRKCDPTYDKKMIDEGIAKEYNGDFYVSSNWSAVLIGEAFNRAKKHGLNEKDKITNVVCDFTNEPYYNNNGTKVYSNPTLKIFDFEFYGDNSPKGMDIPPKVEENETYSSKEDTVSIDSSDNLPF